MAGAKRLAAASVYPQETGLNAVTPAVECPYAQGHWPATTGRAPAIATSTAILGQTNSETLYQVSRCNDCCYACGRDATDLRILNTCAG